MPRIVAPTDQMIAYAADLLRTDQVVAFPTETVYGLGADTFNVSAIELVYELKGRPKDNPLIAHVSDPAQARRVAAGRPGVGGGWDERCDRLVEQFWPGPLTLVLSKAADVPAIATAGRNTIAVRSPSHPVARQLLAAFGAPISAPSANRAGHVSPTSALHVMDDFPSSNLLILDGGASAVGLESTVLDLTRHPATVLRPGAVTIEQLQAVIGKVEAPAITAQAASPGTSPLHYAPRVPAELVDSSQLHSRLSELMSAAVVVLCFDASKIHPPHRAIQMPDNAAEYAATLYRALRQADALAAAGGGKGTEETGGRIVIERPAATGGLWRAVHDRLNRATSDK